MSDLFNSRSINPLTRPKDSGLRLSSSHISNPIHHRPTRSELLSSLHRSTSIIGHDPVNDADKLVKDDKCTAVTGIFTGGMKIISTLRQGSHGDNLLHANDYVNSLLEDAGFEPLNEEEIDLLANRMVSAWPVPDTGGVRIRADVTHHMLTDAIHMLQDIGVPDSAIELRADDPAQFDRVKQIGAVHRHKVFSHSHPAKFIADHFIKLVPESPNSYFYCASRGERLITPDLLLDLCTSINEKWELLSRIDEIIDNSHKSHTAEGNNIDFLVFQHDSPTRNFDFDTGIFIGALRSISQQIRGCLAWSEEDRDTTREQLQALHSTFCASTNPFFHHDKMGVGNREWERAMSLVLRGIKDEKELDTLGPEYRGHFEVLPSGRLLTLPPATGSFGISKVGFHFEKNTPSDVRDLLNLTLATHPDLSYAYVCEVPERFTRRVPEFETARFVEEGPHRSLIVVYQAGDQPENKLHLKRFRWPSYHLEDAYKELSTTAVPQITTQDIFDYVDLQHYCLQSLGLQTTGVEMVTLRETTDNGDLLEVEYYQREFVTGRPLSHEDLLSHPAGPDNETPTLNEALAYQAGLASLKGGTMAAYNLFMRRQYFARSNEILSTFSESGVPLGYHLTSPRSAFPAFNGGSSSSPLDDAALYSADLAADMVAIDRSGLGDPQRYRNHFIEALPEAWGKLRQIVDRKESEIEAYIDRRYASRSQSNSVNPDCDIRPGWLNAVRGLRAITGEQAAAKIDSRVDPIIDLYDYILSGTAVPMEQALLLKEATILLSSSFRSTDHVDQQQLIEVITKDSSFSSLNLPERMRRLHALEFSAWAKRRGIPMNFIIDIGRSALRDSSDSPALAASVFVKLMQRLPGVHMRDEDAATGFIAIFDTPDPDEHVSMLEEAGYLLHVDHP